MKKYRITGKVVTISSGVVYLSKEQADARIFNLKPIGKGKEKYQVIKPVFFKAGEIIGLQDDLPKSLASEIESQPGKQNKSDDDQEVKADTDADVTADSESKDSSDNSGNNGVQ